MTRRDFIARLGLAAGAVALTPLLDLAPILPAPSAACIESPYVAYLTTSMNVWINNPGSCGIITGIGA